MKKIKSKNTKLVKAVALAVLLGSGGVLAPAVAEAAYVYSINGQSISLSGTSTATDSGGGSIAVGIDNTVRGNAGVAMGLYNNANGGGSVAMGNTNSTEGEASVAMGYGNKTGSGFASVAIGGANESAGYVSVAIGEGNLSTGHASVAMGTKSQAYGKGSVALGKSVAGSAGDDEGASIAGIDTYAFAAGNSTASGIYSTATGTSTAGAGYSVAMGVTNKANGGASVAMGHSNTTNGEASVAMGYGNKTGGGFASVAIGGANEAAGYASVAIGESNLSTGRASVAIGRGSQAYGEGSVALGKSTAGVSTTDAETDTYAFAAGTSTAGGEYSVAMGKASVASGKYSVALNGGTASAENAIALGGTASHANSLALGSGSTTSAANQVSVGNGTTNRKIVNVANGSVTATSTDAVTGKQLYGATTMSSAGNYYVANAGVTTAVAAVDAKIGKIATDGTYAKQANTVSANLIALDTRAKTNADAITLLNSNSTTEGSVDYKIAQALGGSSSDMKANSYKVGDDTYINSAGLNANNKKIANVADGDVTATSTDAVNGKQLYNATTMSSAGNYYVANAGVTTAVAAVDAKIGKIATDGTYAKQANTVSANLIALDSKIGALSADGNYITKAGTVSANLSALDTRAQTNADAITLLNSNSTTEGSVDYKIAQALGGSSSDMKANSYKVGDDTYINSAGLNANNKKITNVADGDVSSTSTDAVNGKQLYNATLMGTAGNYYLAADNVVAAVKKVDTQVGTNTTNIATNTTAIALLNNTEATTGSVKNSIKTALDTRVGTIADGNYIDDGDDVAENLTALDTAIHSLASATSPFEVAGTTVSLRNLGKITNVQNGEVSSTSTDVVTGKQLYQYTNMATAGNYYTINSNVVTALAGVDAQVKTNANAIAFMDDYVTSSGLNANSKKIVNVADGSLAADSMDAVTGKQLYATNANVTANAAAIATNATNIAANTTAIGVLNGADTVTGSVAKSIKDAMDLKVGSISGTSYQAIDKDNTVSANLVSLDNTIKAFIAGSSILVDSAFNVDVTTHEARLKETGKITNVVDGEIAADSKDVVTGKQLYATNSRVTANETAIATNTGNISTNTAAIALLNGADTETGSVANSIKTAVGTVPAGTYQTIDSGKTVAENLVALDAVVKTALTGGTFAVESAFDVNTSTHDASLKEKGKITNVADGEISATSTDVVTGKQLYGVTNVTGAGNYYSATDTMVTALGKVDTQVKTNADAIALLNDTDLVTGSVASTVKTAMNTRLGTISAGGHSVISETKTVAENLAALETAITAGITADSALDVDSTTHTASLHTAGKITNVLDGEVSATSKDVVTGKQLYNATIMGTAGNYYLGTDGIAAAVGKVDTKVKANTDAITLLNSNSTTEGSVDYKIAQALGGNFTATDVTAANYKVGTDTYISSTGLNANNKKIINVGEGTVSSTSTDAVSGKQLYDASVITDSHNYYDGSSTATNVKAALGLVDAQVKTNADAIGLMDDYVTSTGLNANNKTISNVAEGTLSDTSTDAVSGKQLYNAIRFNEAGNYYLSSDTVTQAVKKVDAQVKTNMGAIATNTTDIATNTTDIATNTSNIGTLQTTVSGHTTSISTLTTSVGNNTTAIATLNGGVTDSGSVAYQIAQALTGGSSDVKATSYKVGDDTYINSAGLNANNKKIANVADGDVTATSTDAVTGKQLYGATTMSSAGNYYVANAGVTTAVAAVDAKIGKIATDGTYAKQANTVSANLIALDTRAQTNADAITLLNSNSTTEGSVAYKIAQALGGNFTATDVTAANYKVGTDTYISSTGLNANNKKIINVGEGTVSSTSTDAVTGKQLYDASVITDSHNYYDGSLTATNVKAALGLVDAQVKTNANVIAMMDDYVTSTGLNANGKKVVNVLAGDVSDTSTDVVIGKQLYSATIMPTAGQYYSSGDNVVTALGKVDTQVKANTNIINTLNGDASTAGSVANKIAAEVGTLDTRITALEAGGGGGGGGGAALAAVTTEVSKIENYVTDDGLNAQDKKITGVDTAGALSATNTNAVNGADLYNATTMATDGNSYSAGDTVGMALGKVDSKVAANTEAIDVLNGDASTIGSVDYKVAQAVSTEISMGSVAGNYYAANASAVNAIKTVDAQVKKNADAISSANIGSGNVVTGSNSAVLGYGNTVTGDKLTAVGYGHTITGTGSGAFGDPSTVVGDGSYAYGNDNTVYGDGSYVMGNNNNIGASGSPVNDTFVIGSNVTTSARNSVILGAGSTATEDNVVSVGSSASKRKIVNVADGTIASGSSDAVTGGQLYDKIGDLSGGTYTTISATNNVSKNLAALDAALATGVDSAFEIDPTTYDAKLKNKGKITNIAAGTSAYDAVNYEQFSELTNNMERGFSKVNEEIGRTGAASAALASLHPQMMRKGESQVMAGMGRYHGKSGAAVGLAWQPHSRVMLSGGFADAAGEIMFNVGASYKFGQHSYTPEELAELNSGTGMPLYVAELNSVLKSKDNKISIIEADYAMLKADNAVMKEKLDRLEGILARILASAKK